MVFYVYLQQDYSDHVTDSQEFICRREEKLDARPQNSYLCKEAIEIRDLLYVQ